MKDFNDKSNFLQDERKIWFGIDNFEELLENICCGEFCGEFSRYLSYILEIFMMFFSSLSVIDRVCYFKTLHFEKKFRFKT